MQLFGAAGAQSDCSRRDSGSSRGSLSACRCLQAELDVEAVVNGPSVNAWWRVTSLVNRRPKEESQN